MREFYGEQEFIKNKIYIKILEVSNELEAIGGKHADAAESMLPCAASYFMAKSFVHFLV